jgi:hypothetical protein
MLRAEIPPACELLHTAFIKSSQLRAASSPREPAALERAQQSPLSYALCRRGSKLNFTRFGQGRGLTDIYNIDHQLEYKMGAWPAAGPVRVMSALRSAEPAASGLPL